MTKPGYEIGRDERGFTEREREVLHEIVDGKNMSDTARDLGMSRQRVHQVVEALKKKGVEMDVLRRIR